MFHVRQKRPSGGARGSLTSIGGAGKASEANDATVRGASGTLCGSVRVNSLLEIMLLTYHIVQKMPYKVIVKEHQVELHTACDWFQFCREVILDLIKPNRK